MLRYVRYVQYSTVQYIPKGARTISTSLRCRIPKSLRRRRFILGPIKRRKSRDENEMVWSPIKA